jgi:DNA-damage-inducible protein J
MAKAEFIRARVDETLKTSTETLFARLGLTMTEAITLFLTQCEMRQGLPFEVKIPNEETRRALDEAHAGVGIISHNTVEDMFKGWDK